MKGAHKPFLGMFLSIDNKLLDNLFKTIQVR